MSRPHGATRSLFAPSGGEAAGAPLADRMRPRSLEEFVGQEHIVGPGRLLRRSIEADRLSSLIFHGPPGTGKTTLARVIANSTAAHFATLNAVLSGVKDIRTAVAAARERREVEGRATILFVDEVHRFNKAQQDALLPWVENGTVVLIGATTENPYFEVNKALVSRSRIFQLLPLEGRHLRAIAAAALADSERGYGDRHVVLADDALDHLVNVAGGDARAVLNALELAVETTPPDEAGRIVIGLAAAEDSIQRRAVLYDKEGDVHYDTISAFIKSLRGSDPDAALYWLARMVYAGEDPRFLFRRMLILAAEDVGLADPQAVGTVVACATAFDYVGLPEGQFHLAEAALYLALAPKSNTTLGYFDAMTAVKEETAGDVPAHLKDGNRDREGFGHGAGYRYPHAYSDHWVAQQYLPAGLAGRVFYRPSRQGLEGRLAQRTARRREAQLAAAVATPPPSEILTFTGRGAGSRGAWLSRTAGAAADRLGAVRDAVLKGAAIPRHGLVLDLTSPAGLLTWEALRLAPEGGVWTLGDGAAAAALRSLAEGLDPLEAPTVVEATPAAAAEALAEAGAAAVRFDAVVGLGGPDAILDAKGAVAIAPLLAPAGRVSLAWQAPDGGPMPSDLLPDGALEGPTMAALVRAEAAAQRPAPTATGALVRGLKRAGLIDVAVEEATHVGRLDVTAHLVDRWFAAGAEYRRILATVLDEETLGVVQAAFRALVGAPARPWPARWVHVRARRPPEDQS